MFQQQSVQQQQNPGPALVNPQQQPATISSSLQGALQMAATAQHPPAFISQSEG